MRGTLRYCAALVAMGVPASAQTEATIAERTILWPLEASCVDAFEAGQTPDLSMFSDPFGAAGMPLAEGEQRGEPIEGLYLRVDIIAGQPTCSYGVERDGAVAALATKDILGPALDGWIERFRSEKGYALWPGCSGEATDLPLRMLYGATPDDDGMYVFVSIPETMGVSYAFGVTISRTPTKPEGC